MLKEKTFFARVDRQLNKVCEFHLKQEKELERRGHELWSQLETLLEMRHALHVQALSKVGAKAARGVENNDEDDDDEDDNGYDDEDDNDDDDDDDSSMQIENEDSNHSGRKSFGRKDEPESSRLTRSCSVHNVSKHGQITESIPGDHKGGNCGDRISEQESDSKDGGLESSRLLPSSYSSSSAVKTSGEDPGEASRRQSLANDDDVADAKLSGLSSENRNGTEQSQRSQPQVTPVGSRGAESLSRPFSQLRNSTEQLHRIQTQETQGEGPGIDTCTPSSREAKEGLESKQSIRTMTQTTKELSSSAGIAKRFDQDSEAPVGIVEGTDSAADNLNDRDDVSTRQDDVRKAEDDVSKGNAFKNEQEGVGKRHQDDVSKGDDVRVKDNEISKEGTTRRKEDDDVSKAQQTGFESISESSGSDGLEIFRWKSIAQHQIKLNLPATTPLATISKLSRTLWEDIARRHGNQQDKRLSKEEGFALSVKAVDQADQMLRSAFVEFYHAAYLLRSYSALNAVAFVKITKKHDKVAGWDASSTYLPVVENAYFHTSNKSAVLMDAVEKIFTQHFAKNSHRKAMNTLRPVRRSASHAVTFFLGLFLGLGLALLFGFCLILYSQGGYTQAGGRGYLVSVFPVWSTLALILLHIYLYGWNIWAWRRCRINFTFIFELTPGKELRHRQILMICGGLTCVLLGGMVLHLAVRARNYNQNWASELVPLIAVLVFVIFLVQPFDFMYRSSRWFFIVTIWHCVLAPLYKVSLPDFFMGDQLTSQVYALRNVEYILCFYGAGLFITRESAPCTSNYKFQILSYVIAMLPFWFRLMQCARRLVDEGDRMHIYNGGKYVSAMAAVALKLAVTYHRSTTLVVLFSITSAVATAYQTYWDLVIDWGLLRRKSENPWLRDKLILKKRKWVYFVSMALNVILRFAWLQSVTRLSFGGLSRNINDFIFAALEIFRRGQWNFYRLENEHLNNVGKFRAVRTVPLPFRDLEDSDS